ncbi:MAG: ABC transporter ATP-binding protein [Candidatus Cloacimonadales bacterium]|jgi:ATP-binding cassette subfamily B protein/subfamily B ATP-binding cassette protein MsbA|nr:ABC transporter ATP-binding protein/permease [Candidatus Cloacimonadota bacterium]MDD3500894.1 ABC transporter ATP-binding protein [Candidatus Cloacimonadota bacterium]MDX9977673.1 ABC transporter ATP-binding protein [Candidatus Cloacimonadales bacterium]MDY0196138.1 ABC transporter ATP-binding protein [Sulfurovaceae bacterium]
MSQNFGMQADEILGKIYDKKLYVRLLRYLKPYLGWVGFAVVLLTISACLEIYMPLLTKNAMDNHIVSDKRILTLNTDEYAHFEAMQKMSRFKTYQVAEKNYIVLTTKNSRFIPKEDMALYEENKLISKDKYVFIESNDDINSILSEYQDEVIKLEQGLIAVPSSILAKLNIDDKLVVRKDSMNKIVLYGLAFLIFTLIKAVIQFLQLVITTIFSQKATNDLRSDLFHHLQKLPVSFFDKNPVGRLVTRTTNDVRALDEMLSDGVLTIIQDAAMVIAIIVLMLFLHWRLALVSFIVLPFVIQLIRVYKNKTRVTYREVRKRLAAVNATLAEHISGMKIIQIFNQSKNKRQEFADTNQSYFSESMRQLKLFAMFRPTIRMGRQVAIAIVLWYAGGQILQNTLTIGVFMAFMTYLEKLYDPISEFSEKFNILQGAMAGAERIFDLMDYEEADYREDAEIINGIDGDIEFKNLYLSYVLRKNEEDYKDEDFVLKNISFKVKAGEKIALVGHTGSGKTSIVNLILGMYPYQKGEILIDNKPLEQYRLEDLRSRIGMVQQDVFLFSGTIRDNIALNNHKITDEEIERICEYVNVMPFIKKMKDGFDEPVMERGSTLSVGQRQLISFARVLAYDPSIFILDEATANIDTETEILIQDALQKLMEKRTSLIIAHRLSTIQHVDRILVLHKGEIVEEGSHQELLKKEGLYYDLYRLQYA